MNDQPLIMLYGPNPGAGYRSGGVAVWMRYLGEIVDATGLEHESLYIDRGVREWRGLPRPLMMAMGILAAVGRIVRVGSTRQCVVHVNSSLYRRTAFRELPIVAISALTGVPVFLQVHGGRLSNLQGASVSRHAWRWILRTVEALGIHPGPQWEEFVAAGYRGKMYRMFNAVPASGKTAETRQPAARFLFLGRITPDKGVWEVLESFERVRKELSSQPSLTIAGKGPCLDAVRTRASRSKYRDDISVTGFLEGEALEAVMRRSNVFVLPSRHQEGFPFSFLEAGERGMACLASSNSAIGEVFEAGVEFLEVDKQRPDELYEAMRKVAVDSDLRASLGTAIRSKITRFYTIEASSGRFRGVYERLLYSGDVDVEEEGGGKGAKALPDQPLGTP